MKDPTVALKIDTRIHVQFKPVLHVEFNIEPHPPYLWISDNPGTFSYIKIILTLHEDTMSRIHKTLFCRRNFFL